MAELKILNSRERKNIRKLIEEQYGFRGDLPYVFLLQEKKQKIYLFTEDLANVSIDNLRIDSMGMYFGAIFEGKLRLTIEGSQLVGPQCSTSIVTINEKEQQDWIQGRKLEISELSFPEEQLPEEKSFVIIKHNEDFLGCGKISQGAITNYIPKTRYVHALY